MGALFLQMPWNLIPGIRRACLQVCEQWNNGLACFSRVALSAGFVPPSRGTMIKTTTAISIAHALGEAFAAFPRCTAVTIVTTAGA